MKTVGATLRRLVALMLVSVLALQLYFVIRVGSMVIIDPQSTAFERSEIWRIASDKTLGSWSQHWVAYDHIAADLKRAVIAAEDAGFVEHSGIEWDALEKAWERNQKAEAVAERVNERFERRSATTGAGRAASAPRVAPRLVGGSTITQQLAKNLFLGGERNLVRKAQEIVIAWILEALLSKRRILEIYLNSVEWGAGVFGAEAAARHYFQIAAAKLTAAQAARLAVMLPAPKRFEQRPASPYVLGRAATVMARMGSVELP